MIVLDCWASWCRPCRAFAPVFEEVARRHGGQVAFAKCNVDRNGSGVDRITGLLSRRQLEQLVSGALRRTG